jgi:hypothetical protein
MPASSCRTPIGARQSVGGGASFASWNASNSFSAIGGSTSATLRRLVSPIFSHSAPAVDALTRQKRSCRKLKSVPFSAAS